MQTADLILAFLEATQRRDAAAASSILERLRQLMPDNDSRWEILEGLLARLEGGPDGDHP